MQIFGRFVGNGLDRSVPFTRYNALSVWLQRAAYMPPLRSTRNIVITAKPRAGRAPPLRGGKAFPLGGEGGAERAG